MVVLELWGKSQCPKCDILKRNLEQAGVTYEYRDCDDPETREIALSKMIRAMPTVFIKKNMEVIAVIADLKPTSEYTKYLEQETHLEAEDLEYKESLNG